MSRTSYTSDGEELLYGHKKITLQNYATPDIPRTWNITAEQWVGRVLMPKLSTNAPEEVENLFEVARGSMIYGWFYYPLITLALEQQFRVMEAAAIEKCKALNIPVTYTRKNGDVRSRNFDDLIKSLANAGVIANAEEKRWHACRALRNSVSHPDRQMIIMPAEACRTIETACELINKLFP